MTTLNVDHTLPSVNKMLPQWAVIRDCIDGQEAVKAKTTTYLPMPNPHDTSNANRLRYDSYMTRALFINYTSRTLNGMVGTAFSKEPVFTVPKQLDILHEDVDGGAVTIDQQARQVLSDVLSVGRCGLLSDYPTMNGPTYQDQINRGEVRPTIQFYFAEDIINWRYETVNALRRLTLVVLREKVQDPVDEFKAEDVVQYRVLRLEDGVYTVELYREGEKGFESHGKVTPMMKGRRPFDYIPFEFVGSRNNDGGIDEAPLRSIAAINIAHYRNSADFEEMVFVLGQPTTVIAGLSQAWVTEVLKGEVVLGSTSALMLPEGATAEFLQINESQLALSAMEHKETQLVAIGAKLVNQNTVQRTAKEAGMDDASDQSVLVSAVHNVNSAYKNCLRACALFAGATVTDDIGYELNTDFEIMQLDQAALTGRVKMWVDGAITFTELRSTLRRAGIAELDDEAARAEMQKDALDNAAAMGLGPDGSNPLAPDEDEEEGVPAKGEEA